MSEDMQTYTTKRITVPSAEAILGKLIPCLDDGFVRLVDYMGGDVAIVQAARVSYGKGTKNIQEDEGLIRYLLRHDHTTPFEMCEIKLHARVPMDAWRQWVRHRTANINEYSTRYSLAIDAAQKTPKDKWRMQSKDNKQGSSGFFDILFGEKFSVQEQQLHDLSRSIYEERVNAGMAREQARKDLPLSTYTELYWKNDLHNILRFLNLRMDSHAQYEIRVYANAMAQIVEAVAPKTYKAFADYKIGGTRFSKLEYDVLSNVIDKEKINSEIALISNLLSKPKGEELIYHGEVFGKTELRELQAKFSNLLGKQ